MSQTTLTAEAVDVTAATTALKQWVLIPASGTHVLQKNSFGEHQERNFALKGTKINRYLQWEDQTFGINIGWTDDASPNTAHRVTRWFVNREAGSEKPITYGEHIALGNGNKPSYIVYADRDFGVNLKFADTPRYEWMVLGGKIGQPVKANTRVALFNVNAGSDASPGNFFMYFDRTVGGDVGWPDSKTWGEQLGGKLKGLAWSAAKEYIKSRLGL